MCSWRVSRSKPGPPSVAVVSTLKKETEAEALGPKSSSAAVEAALSSEGASSASRVTWYERVLAEAPPSAMSRTAHEPRRTLCTFIADATSASCAPMKSRGCAEAEIAME